MKNKIPSFFVLSLLLASLSIPGMAQKYGPEIDIAPGIHPHCTRSHNGSLHVVAVNGDQIEYVNISPDGIPGNPEIIAHGIDLQAPYIAESRNKILHVVWGDGYNVMYSNNVGGSWQVKTMLPPVSGNSKDKFPHAYGKNRFPHVAGGYGNEAYVASWNHSSESVREGVHVAYQVNVDKTGKVTGIKSRVMGKVCEVAPSVVGPTALLDCGGEAFGVATAPGNPDFYTHAFNENFDVTSVEAIGNRPPNSRWVLGGVDAFPMEDGPAILGEIRTSSRPLVTGILVNFKGSGKTGAMFLESVPNKNVFPRGSYDAVSKNIYGIYNKKGKLVLGIFDTETFSLRDVSSQPVSIEISAGTAPGECGWGAGGIAARISGGADLVYSIDNMIKMRSVDARENTRNVENKKKLEEGPKNEKAAPKKRPLYEARVYNGLPYRLMKPKNYAEGESYPLIISLHGIEGVGSDNVKNLSAYNTGIMATDEWRDQYQCFVVVPQCTMPPWTRPQTLSEKQKETNLEQVFQVIEGLQRDFRYQIDHQRIYILGHGMGGSGCWTALQEKPDLFAAAISVGGGLEEFADKGIAVAKDIPVWTFCGMDDEMMVKSEQAYERFKEVGGCIKFTSLKGVGAESWPIAFHYKGDKRVKAYVTKMSKEGCGGEMDVWKWLFNQKRENH